MRFCIQFTNEDLEDEQKPWWNRSVVPFHLLIISTFNTRQHGKTGGNVVRNYEKRALCCDCEMRNTGVFYAWGCAYTRGYVRVRVLARTHVKNLIQNAAKHGLILWAYSYEGVCAENTHFYMRLREDKRTAKIRVPAREDKVACISAAFSTLSFFNATKLLATGQTIENAKFYFLTVRNAIIQNILDWMRTMR